MVSSKKQDVTRRKRRDEQKDAPAALRRWPARWVAGVLPVLVLGLGFAAFLPALDAKFVNYDDDRLFVENTSYRGLSPEHLRWMFSTTFMGHYQPLTWLSAAVDYEISGTNPSSYHRNNLILHSLNGVLVYFVCLRLLGAGLRIARNEYPTMLRLAAGVGALLFAVHPLRVESVAWAAERRDVLSGFLLLSALLAYLRAVDVAGGPLRSRGWFVASCGLLALSLLSKAWGMSFFLIAVVLDWYPLRRLPAQVSLWREPELRALWMQKIPFLILGLAAAVVAGYAQRSALDTMRSLADWGIGDRLVQAVFGLAFYVEKTVWPTGLGPCYELPYQLDAFEPRFVRAYVVVAVAGALVVVLRRKLPALAAAAIVYVVLLAPVLGIAQSGPQLVADRYSYLACTGWVILAAGGLLTVWSGSTRVRRGVAAMAVVVIGVLFAATWRQTRVWHDSRSLWDHAVTVAPPSSLANLNRGILLRREGQVDEAIACYQAAVEVRPDTGNAWFALGNVLKQEKRDYAAAEPAYRRAAEFMTQKHRAYLNLGNMYYNELGRVEDAIEAYRAAIAHVEAQRSKMFTPTPYLALGIALRRAGQSAEAREALEVARKHSRTRERAEDELRRLDEEARLPEGR